MQTPSTPTPSSRALAGRPAAGLCAGLATLLAGLALAAAEPVSVYQCEHDDERPSRAHNIQWQTTNKDGDATATMDTDGEIEIVGGNIVPPGAGAKNIRIVVLATVGYTEIAGLRILDNCTVSIWRDGTFAVDRVGVRATRGRSAYVSQEVTFPGGKAIVMVRDRPGAPGAAAAHDESDTPGAATPPAGPSPDPYRQTTVPAGRNVRVGLPAGATEVQYAGLTFVWPITASVLPDGTLLVTEPGVVGWDGTGRAWHSRETTLDGRKVCAFFPDQVEADAARTWSDVSGTFEVSARLLGVTAGRARLQKVDGNVIEVPLDRLSQGDQDFVKAHPLPPAATAAALAGRPAPTVPPPTGQPPPPAAAAPAATPPPVAAAAVAASPVDLAALEGEARRLGLPWPLPQTVCTRAEAEERIRLRVDEEVSRQVPPFDVAKATAEAEARVGLWKVGDTIEFNDARDRPHRGRLTRLTPARLEVGGAWVSEVDFSEEMRRRLDPARAERAVSRDVQRSMQANAQNRAAAAAQVTPAVTAKVYEETGFVRVGGAWQTRDEVIARLSPPPATQGPATPAPP